MVGRPGKVLDGNKNYQTGNDASDIAKKKNLLIYLFIYL
jgi:hypothetical protein